MERESATKTSTITNVIPSINDVEFDWRTKGAFNLIKDQGTCGSCWVFSTIQCCKSAKFLKYNTFYRFSEQSLVDCITVDSGCDGGLPEEAFKYIINECNGKDDYPYLAIDDTCKFNSNKAIGHFTHVVYVKQTNEDDLAEKCQNIGPDRIGIDASQNSFQLYSGGIYVEPDCSFFFSKKLSISFIMLINHFNIL